MANETTRTSITEAVYAEYIDLAVGEYLREETLMIPMCKKMDISDKPTDTGTFLFADTISLSSQNDGAASSNTEFTLNDVAITVGVKSVFCSRTKLAARSSGVPIDDVVFQETLAAAFDAIETSLCALLGGGSQHVGTTTVNLTAAVLLSAIPLFKISAKRKSRKAAIMLYPQQVDDVRQDMISATTGLSPSLGVPQLASIFGADQVNSAMLGAQADFSFCKLPVFESSLVPTANAAADSAGALFSVGDAFGYVVKWNPEFSKASAVVNFRLEDVLATDVAYGAGELRDACVISIITDR